MSSKQARRSQWGGSARRIFLSHCFCFLTVLCGVLTVVYGYNRRLTSIDSSINATRLHTAVLAGQSYENFPVLSQVCMQRYEVYIACEDANLPFLSFGLKYLRTEHN